MDGQLIVVSVIVASATLYLARQTWRTWSGRKAGGCGGGCKCDSKTAQGESKTSFIPVESIGLRQRPEGPL
ncbi:MAG: FeoB-associated Cys-rich membrane protein [Gemmataceae bacterium]|nr:FeoB-associated Cys-rich membrane protein [Gemmataceae bacterium]